MMQKNQIIRRTLPLVLVIATTPVVHAAVTPTVPPVAISWVNIADTHAATLARDPLGASIIPNVNFLKFDPPVVSQYTQGLAFKGWLTAPATPANDEGVWSTAPQLSSSGTPHIATLVLRKGDPVFGSTIGATFGAVTLNVENLQCASNDWTVCMTNTTPVGGKVAIGFNNLTFTNLAESSTAAWSDIRPPVITNFQTNGSIASWRKTTTPQSGVRRFIYTLPNTPSFALWDTGLGGTYRNNQPPRIASPSISDGGAVAAYARDFNLPSNNHIQLRSPTGGLGGAIVRELTPALTVVPGFITATANFGTIHNRLMANSDSIVAGSELVTWQMATMRNPLVINRTSLWCKHNNTYSCLAFKGQPAPSLPAGNTIDSFYALHAVPDSASPGDHWIFWGAMIAPGNKVAIYRTHVSTTAGTPDVIASSVTGTCPVDLISGGTHNISAIDRYFSVNIQGTVLFKATCVTVPPAQRQILVTADVVSGHSRKVRAQSGVSTAGVPVGGAFPPASNFQLAAPEQGSCSRGQAIGTQWLAAKVLYSGGSGQGVFWAFQ